MCVSFFSPLSDPPLTPCILFCVQCSEKPILLLATRAKISEKVDLGYTSEKLKARICLIWTVVWDHFDVRMNVRPSVGPVMWRTCSAQLSPL